MLNDRTNSASVSKPDTLDLCRSFFFFFCTLHAYQTPRNSALFRPKQGSQKFTVPIMCQSWADRVKYTFCCIVTTIYHTQASRKSPNRLKSKQKVANKYRIKTGQKHTHTHKLDCKSLWLNPGWYWLQKGVALETGFPGVDPTISHTSKRGSHLGGCWLWLLAVSQAGWHFPGSVPPRWPWYLVRF